jgi:hypothetical protein
MSNETEARSPLGGVVHDPAIPAAGASRIA